MIIWRIRKKKGKKTKQYSETESTEDLKKELDDSCGSTVLSEYDPFFYKSDPEVEDEEEKDPETETVGSSEVKRKLWKRIPGFGLILCLCSVVISNGMNIIIKEFTAIEPAVLMLYRSIFTLSFAMPWAVSIDKPPFPPGMSIKNKLLLLYRGVLGFANIIANIYSVRYMNLGDQKMLSATHPIFVSISARIFLGESFGVLNLLSMLFMLVGIVFVVKPPFIFGLDSGSEYNSLELYSAIAVFVTTALSSNNTVIARKLRKEHVASLLAANQLFFTIESFLFIIIFSIEFYNPSWEDKLKISTVALGMFLGAILHMLAIKLEKANKVAILSNSSSIVVAFLIQILYFEVIPGMFSAIGASLVSLSILTLAVKPFFLSQKKTCCIS